MQPIAIPVSGELPTPGKAGVGSAFLAQMEGTVYLITAAHVPIAEKPTNDWGKYASRLTYRHSEGQVNIDLFDEIDGQRVPRFGYLKLHDDEHKILDALWFPLVGALAPALPVLTKTYRVLDLESTVALDVLVAHGYPASSTPWPALPAVTVTGAFAGRQSLVVLGTEDVEEGMSGGPVVNADGELVGMVFGSTGSMAQIIPKNVLTAGIRG